MKMFHLDKVCLAECRQKKLFRGMAMQVIDASLPGLDSHGFVHAMREGGLKK